MSDAITESIDAIIHLGITTADDLRPILAALAERVRAETLAAIVVALDEYVAGIDNVECVPRAEIVGGLRWRFANDVLLPDELRALQRERDAAAAEAELRVLNEVLARLTKASVADDGVFQVVELMDELTMRAARLRAGEKGEG